MLKKAKIVSLIIAAMLLVFPLVAQAGTVLEFETMVGVSGPFIGYPIRYIAGGNYAWAVGDARGRLLSDGRLLLDIEGLVLKDTGENPVPVFYAFVSCLKKGMDEMGMPKVVVKNIVSEGFDADVSGDATLDTMVELPGMCVNPVIMVGTVMEDGTKAWFATTGFKHVIEDETEPAEFE